MQEERRIKNWQLQNKKKHGFNIPLINLKKFESVQVPIYHQLVQWISIDKTYWNKL